MSDDFLVLAVFFVVVDFFAGAFFWGWAARLAPEDFSDDVDLAGDFFALVVVFAEEVFVVVAVLADAVWVTPALLAWAARRDFSRAALFLCITPFLTAVSRRL